MKISEIQPKQGKIDVTGQITEKQDPRTFNKFGKEGRVCNATLKDDSGQVALTLWNEQVDQVNVGDTVTIKNGYAGEWQGEIQLSTGKFGTLEVSKGDGQPAPTSEPAPEPKMDVEEERLG